MASLDKKWPSYLLKKIEELKAHVVRMEQFTYEFHPDYYGAMTLHHEMLKRLEQSLEQRYAGLAKKDRLSIYLKGPDHDREAEANDSPLGVTIGEAPQG